MKYFYIVFMMSIFVIAYVWQNIEVMKMKMDYNKMVRQERNLAEKNDRITAELERLRSFRYIDGQIEKAGLVRITPGNVFVIDIDKIGKKGSK